MSARWRDLIRRQLPTGARLLHAGNEESRGDLAGRLQRRGLCRPASSPIFRAVPVDGARARASPRILRASRSSTPS